MTRTRPQLIFHPDRYVLEDLLGQGGYGQVWRALETRSERTVALKILLQNQLEDQLSLDQFEREIRAAASFTHPLIVPILDTGHDLTSGRAYYAMPMLTGRDLNALRPPLRLLLELIDQLLEALAYAHARNIIHRDLKPANVMVGQTPEGAWRVHLLDFGVAMLQDATQRLEEDNGHVGTVAYMSPEQARGTSASVGPASDLYSVGIILYELLSGRLPFDGHWMMVLVRHTNEPPPPLTPRDGLPEPLPPALLTLLDDLLAKRYQDRPESAADVRRRLAPIIEALPAGSGTWTPAPNVETSAVATAPTLASDDKPQVELLETLPTLPRQGAETEGAHPELVGEPDVTARSDAGPQESAYHPTPQDEPDPRATPQPEPVEPEGEEAPLEEEQLTEIVCNRTRGCPPLLRLRDVPVIGRDDTLERINQLVDNPRGPQAVLMTGPAGLGKTHTMRAVARRALELGTRRVIQINLASHKGLSTAMHAAIYRMLRHPRLEPRPLRERIAEALAFDDERHAEALARFLLIESHGHHASAQEDRADLTHHAQLWNRTLLRAWAYPTPRPLLVWLDGPDTVLHPDEVTDWVASLLDHAATVRAPVLVAWSTRSVPYTAPLPRALARLAERTDVEHIALRPLPQESLAELCRTILPQLSTDSLSDLQHRSDGNPAFLRELIIDWLDSEIIQPQDGRYVFNPQLSLQIPTQLRELLRNRVVAFCSSRPDPGSAHRAMTLLALLGEAFPTAMARRVLAEAQVTVEELLQEGFVTGMVGTTREPQLNYTPSLLRELLLEQAEHNPQLPALRERSATLRLEGALDAMVRTDWEAAARHLGVAWHILDTIEAPPWDLRRLDALDVWTTISYRRRDVEHVRAWARSLIERAAMAPDDVTRDRFIAAGVFWFGEADAHAQEYDAARANFERALELASSCGDPSRVARALHGLGWTALRQGDPGAARDGFQRAQRAFRAASNLIPVGAAHRLLRLAEADTLRDLAGLSTEEGAYDASVTLLRQVLALYQEQGDRQGEALALMYLSRAQRHQGNTRRTSQILARAEALIESCEDRHGRAILAWEEAAAALGDARWDDAYRLFGRAGQLFATAGDTQGQAMCANGQGEAARHHGNTDDALRCYALFLDAMTEVGHIHGQGLARTNMGWTCLAADRYDDAHTHFSNAIQVLRDSQARSAWSDALIGQALALALLGHGERATACLRYARDQGLPKSSDKDALQALQRLQAIAHNSGWSDMKGLVEEALR